MVTGNQARGVDSANLAIPENPRHPHVFQQPVKLGKQIHIFVEKSVYSEHSLWLANKDVKGFRLRYAEDRRVHEFIEEVHGLPRNNPICPFETAQEIVEFLKEQWAGLFQRFLQEQSRMGEVRVLEDLQNTAKTLNQLVAFLTDERKNQDEAIRSILLANHPLFQALRNETECPYPLFFTTRAEMASWLGARSFMPVPRDDWDDDEFEEWRYKRGNLQSILRVWHGVFDDAGKIRVITPDEWDDGWVNLERKETKVKAAPPTFEDDDDDLPF